MEKLLFSDSRFRTVASTEGQTDDRLQRRISPIPGSEEGSGAASRLSEYRDRLRNNPQGTLNEIGITAVSDGEARGLSRRVRMPGPPLGRPVCSPVTLSFP